MTKKQKARISNALLLILVIVFLYICVYDRENIGNFNEYREHFPASHT